MLSRRRQPTRSRVVGSGRRHRFAYLRPGDMGSRNSVQICIKLSSFHDASPDFGSVWGWSCGLDALVSSSVRPKSRSGTSAPQGAGLVRRCRSPPTSRSEITWPGHPDPSLAISRFDVRLQLGITRLTRSTAAFTFASHPLRRPGVGSSNCPDTDERVLASVAMTHILPLGVATRGDEVVAAADVTP